MPHVFTPWRCDAELLQTRDELYKDLSKRREAVQRIEMWTLRGNCPHAVTSTAHLTDAMLQHESEQWSNAGMRSLFASTFARFVTGFCDIGQGSSSRTAMVEVAKLYGMPTWFISLRHEAAHKELPSLLRLERACREALEWLWYYYWAPLGSLDEYFAPAPDLLKQMQSVLRECLQARKQELQSGKDLQAVSKCCDALLELSKGIPRRDFSKTLADCLAAKGTVLLSKKRAEGDSMEGAFKLFDPLLRTLGIHFDPFLALLVRAMLARAAEASPGEDAYAEGLCLWISHAFTDSKWTKSRSATQVQPHRRSVVETCSVYRGNRWTDTLCAELVRTGSANFQEAMQMHADDLPQ